MLGSALVVVGALLLLSVAGTLAGAAMTRERVLGRLSEIRSRDPVVGDAARREVRATGVVGHIESARIALDAAVIEGMGTVELLQGVGHDPASALPGESGNVVLAGHRDTHFRPLRDLRIGDRIDLTTADGRFAYRVDSMRIVGPERTEYLADGGEELLTLITCFPFHWVGPAPRRLVVRAHPVALRAQGDSALKDGRL